MKLAELAKKAAALPELNYQWPGPEHFSDYNFDEATKTPEKMHAYLNELRKKMASYSMALHELTEGYRKMRDLMLAAEVE